MEKNQHGHKGVSDQKPKETIQLTFNTQGRIQVPWPEWEGVEISPEGIHTLKGLLRPHDVDLTIWKSHFYDRGMRGTSRDIMGDFEEKQP